MPSFQDTVLVIGDGPTGLSAALFLTKSGVGCHVLGEGATPVNKAILHNYLGVDGMLGPNFMEHARLQAEGSGAHLHRQKVTRVERTANGFAADTAEGNRFEAQYLVLANGRDPTFARSLAASTKDDVVTIDLNGRTDVDRLYAGGWVARGHKVQVAISVGDGAAIALDILSAIKGKPFHDFDVLPASTADTAAARPPRPEPGAPHAARHAEPEARKPLP